MKAGSIGFWLCAGALGLALFGLLRTEGRGLGRVSPESKTPQATANASDFEPGASVSVVSGREALAEEPASRASLRVTGRVLTPDGLPISGAEIVAGEPRFSEQWGWEGRLVVQEWNVRAHESRPGGFAGLARTFSAEDGRFTLELDAARGAAVHLAVRTPGWIGGDRWVDVAGEAQDAGEVELRPGRILAGRVVDSEGRPIAGASVLGRGTASLDDRRYLDWNGAALATSDGSGNFAFTGAGHDELELAGPGFAATRMAFRELQRLTQQGPVTLERDAPITGRVVGAPAGPQLMISFWLQEENETRRVVCAPDGSFSIAGLASGRQLDLQVLRLSSAGRWEAVAYAREIETGASGVELVVPEACVFRARIVDARSGEPLEDARLGLLDGWVYESEHECQRATLGDGVQQFSALLTGTSCATLFAMSPAHQARAFGELPFRPGEVVELGTLALEPVPSVLVRAVSAPDGAPVVGVELAAIEARLSDEYCGNAFMRCEWAAGEDIHPGWSGVTDARGEARADIASRTAYVITASHPDFLDQSLPLEAAGAAPIELVFRLARSASIEFACLDAPASVPRLEGTIELEHSDGGDWQRWDRLSTDREGRARATKLPAGAWRFRLEEQPWVELTLRAGETVERRLVCVDPETIRLRGRVTDHGQAVVGALVELWGSETTTDGQGGYDFEGLRLGVDELTITHPEFGRVFERGVELAQVETRFEVELALRSIEGRTLDPSGRPLAGVAVWFGEAGQGGEVAPFDAGVTTGADGAFDFEAVSESSRQFLCARAAGWRPLWRELPPGEARELDLRLEPAATLTLVLELPEELLLVFGEATATWLGEGELPVGERVQRGEALPSEAGSARHRFAHLAPGTWRIAYGSFLSEEQRVGADVVLAVGENEALVLQL